MNIYIRIEVLSRELQGRLLLAFVAAERGHRVLIGKHNGAAMLGTKGWPGYPPGIFHDKSLGHSDPKTEMKKVLHPRGWGLSAQDEEHGLVTEQFGEGMLDRFPEEGFDYNHLLFAWGEFDARAIQDLVPLRQQCILPTGSPRVDLWRPDMVLANDADLVHRITDGHRFVLMNPIGGWNPGAPETVFGIDGSESDARHIENYTTRLRLMSSFVTAAEALAQADPDRLVIIRPHPGAPIDIWEKAARRCSPNVIVSRDARLSPWLRSADAVITNGSTVAFEALLLGTPNITFAPDGYFAYDAVTHRIGRAVTTVDALVQETDAARQPSERVAWYSEEARTIVRERFAALEGPLAADRIVDAWEELGRRLGLEGAPPWAKRRKRPHRPQKRLRSFLSGGSQASGQTAAFEAELKRRASTGWQAPQSVFLEKFPPFDVTDVRRFHEGLVQVTGRFSLLRIDPQHDRLLLVTGKG